MLESFDRSEKLILLLNPIAMLILGVIFGIAAWNKAIPGILIVMAGFIVYYWFYTGFIYKLEDRLKDSSSGE